MAKVKLRRRISAPPAFRAVAEKGLRASGAAHMLATAASLRETATELEQAARRLNQDVSPPHDGGGAASPDPATGQTPQVFRRCTISYRYRNQHQVPELRLGGKCRGRR